MKNEFLFKRTLLTTVKKAYATIQELQEGHMVPKNKQLDIKGIAAIKKSSMSKETRNALERILDEDILNAFEINQLKVIKDLAIEDKKIYNSLKKGERKFFKPVTIKSAESYADPMRIQGIKGSIAWNNIKSSDDISINLDERNALDVVKVNINKKNIDILDKYPEIKENVIRFFNSEDKDIYKGVIDSIAIPKDIEVPEWVTEIIDYDEIISNNLSGFPLESIGVGKFSKSDVYTNIIKL